jgi:hypothetical protein
MKASSESGECASLISISCFSARGAGWVAGMAWLRPFRLAMNDPVLPSRPWRQLSAMCADQEPVRERTSGVSRNLRARCRSVSLAQRNTTVMRQQIP